MFFTTTHPSAIRSSAYMPTMRSLDRLLKQALAMPAETGPAVRAGVTADDASWTLLLDVPGVTKEQLVIGIEGQIVRIETLAEAPRAYKRAYELPQDIDATSSVAKLENSVLTLTLAKKQPVSIVTKITIN